MIDSRHLLLFATTALASAVLTFTLEACSSSSPASTGTEQATDAATEPSANGDRDSPAGEAGTSPKDGGRGDREEPTPEPTYAKHVVGFDDIASGTAITNQYAKWFTASSSAGCALEAINNYDFGQSPPNYASTYFSCAAGETADIVFTFAKPVRKLTLDGVGINGTKGVARLELTHADGSVEVASLDADGNSLSTTPIAIPDTAPVTKLAIVAIDDPYGIGIDDLGFEFPE